MHRPRECKEIDLYCWPGSVGCQLIQTPLPARHHTTNVCSAAPAQADAETCAVHSPRTYAPTQPHSCTTASPSTRVLPIIVPRVGAMATAAVLTATGRRPNTPVSRKCCSLAGAAAAAASGLLQCSPSASAACCICPGSCRPGQLMGRNSWAKSSLASRSSCRCCSAPCTRAQAG